MRKVLLFLLCATLPSFARAENKKLSLCVYDPSGESGDLYKHVTPYVLAALDWGVDFGHPEVRQDEKIATEDFRAAKCDAVVITGVRARQFVPGAGTVEALGAVQTYKELRMVVDALAKPAGASFMKKGDIEVAGIYPAGAVYMFLHDRSLKEASALAGLRIATLDFDAAANLMVSRVGGAAVSADISTFSGMFNSGTVDVAYAPATAYKPLELAKGVGSKGGIVRFPVAQLTFMVLTHSEKFPADFSEKSRKYVASQYDTMMQLIDRSEKDIPAKSWIDVPDPRSYDKLFQAVRVELAEKGTYDKAMLHKLMVVRCKEDPTRAECAEKKE